MSLLPESAIFYHIYPLGLSGAPRQNDLVSSPINRLRSIHPWLEHAARLGCNAVYLGPLFEAGTHGYDTVDYYQVDRRLGTGKDLADLVRNAHELGLRVVLDGVFNHVGRQFWAFRDVQEHGPQSPYAGWIDSLRFGHHNSMGDPFTYGTWHGDESLVKLNLANPDARDHLLGAAENWIQEYDIDGLRLDAADCVALEFQGELGNRCRRLRTEFWLMGEVVHGDYRRWVNPGLLDSVTNYEAYKGLYSSLNDHNYFEIAHTLNRQFGQDGLYKDLHLYNFADNHDVNRVASQLKDPRHLFPLYSLLFTMPGIPSIYYGSEFGIAGSKGADDWPIRPQLDLDALGKTSSDNKLLEHLQSLTQLRAELPALRFGDYQQVLAASEQFAFTRRHAGQTLLVVLNAAPGAVELELNLPGTPDGWLTDASDPSVRFEIRNGRLVIGMKACASHFLVAV